MTADPIKASPANGVVVPTDEVLRRAPFKAATVYLQRGWSGVLPLPARRKSPPLKGYTGAGGVDPDPSLVASWLANGHAGGNIGLRLPEEVVGIDVDDYDDKQGAASLAELEDSCGPLPGTWSVTSRGPGASRLLLFSLPPGTDTRSWPDQAARDIELVRRGHRYAVVWPSIHPWGDTYRWYRGAATDPEAIPPCPSDMTMLPDPWVEYLQQASRRRPRPGPAVGGDNDSQAWRSQLAPGPACRQVATLQAAALAAARRAHGSAHDNTRAALGALLRAGDRGHRGVPGAIAKVRDTFVTTIADRADEREAQTEFDSMVTYQIHQVAQTPDERTGTGCDCEAPWEPVVPLMRSGDLPSFPVEVLPPWLRHMVIEVARSTQTSTDLTGLVAMGVLSGALGGALTVKAKDDWIEPVNLYMVAAAPPGSRKSAVHQMMLWPLHDAERALVEEHRESNASLDRQFAEIELKKAQDRLKRAAEPDRARCQREVLEKAHALDRAEVEPTPRLLADDVTPEALVSLLAEQGGRLVVASAEGGLFETMAGRYSSGVPNIEALLKAHSGDTVRVDRKGRPPERIANPALTLILTVQPSVLVQLSSTRSFRDRGLIARIVYALPPNNVGHRKVGQAAVPSEVRERYARQVKELAVAGYYTPAPDQLTLDTRAQELLAEFDQSTENGLAPGNRLSTPGLIEWASKRVGLALRFAALLAKAGDLTDDGVVTIDSTAMDAGITLCAYYTEHARDALSLMGQDPDAEDAQWLLTLLKQWDRERFTKKQLFDHLSRSRFPNMTRLTQVLALLEAHGYVRPVDVIAPKRKGRSPSPTFEVHPSVVKPRPGGDDQQSQ